MRKLTNFCFKGGKKQFTVVRRFDATWTDDKYNFKITFHKAFLKLTIIITF